MTVIDASVIVAALLDDGPVGAWAETVVAGGGLIAPQLLPAECSNILRRMEARGLLSEQATLLAFADLAALPVTLHAFAPFGPRVIELRRTVTSYDSWYIALAEVLEEPLATCDLRLTRVPGPRCRFLTPPAAPVSAAKTKPTRR